MQWNRAMAEMSTLGRRRGPFCVLLGTPRRCLSGRNTISTQSAMHTLGISREQGKTLTFPQLRQAYFVAAKRCHPDMQPQKEASDEAKCSGTDDFLRLTAAYEYLSQSLAGVDLNGTVISADEEAKFRAACDSQLGVPAEIVEECKRSPIFRQWLGGRTDAAHTWRDFLMNNGGLAPKLAPVAGQLPMSASITPRLRSRRKRR